MKTISNACKSAICLALLLGWMGCATDRNFKKAHRQYLQKTDLAAAEAAFDAFSTHPKYGPASRFFLQKIALDRARDLPDFFEINAALPLVEPLRSRLPEKTARRHARRYGLTADTLLVLQTETQRRALALAEAWETLPVLDSLLAGIPEFLPEVQPRVDSLRRRVVNSAIHAQDYDLLTAVKNHHFEWILPENYGVSRQILGRLWPLFLEKYGPCALDRFVRDHPISSVGMDCWQAEAKAALCSDDLAALLFFHEKIPWSILEYQVMRAIFFKNKSEKNAPLDAAQQARVADVQLYFSLNDQLRGDAPTRDTALMLKRLRGYVERQAPRYSAFRAMQNGLQFLLENEKYQAAIELLESARPFFPDTLPQSCRSDFDYQKRARPYVDGVLPILRRPAENYRQTPLAALNTPDGNEFSPVLDGSESLIFFGASERPDCRAGQDVFFSKKINGVWSPPQLVRELSGPGDQAPLSLTADGREMLLRINGRLHRSRSDAAGRWSPPEEMPLPELPVVGKAMLTADGSVLAFEGSYSGGTAMQEPDLDVFIAEKQADGSWGRAVALGADINTDGNEGNIFLSADKKTLWYTSSGYPGLGLGDVFVSQRRSARWTDWTRPTHLGKELNDTRPHRGFSQVSTDGKRAYFTRFNESGRRGEIWMVEF